MFQLGGEAQKRLEELAKCEPSGLSEERILCKYLLEAAAKGGCTGTANALLATSARLSLADEAAKIRANQVLSRTALVALMREVVEIVVDEISTLADADAIADRIIRRIADSVEKVENTEKRHTEPIKDKS
jgi:hypothetical protein